MLYTLRRCLPLTAGESAFSVAEGEFFAAEAEIYAGPPTSSTIRVTSARLIATVPR